MSNLACLLNEDGEREQAEDLFRRATKLSGPGAALAWINLGEQYEKKGDVESARAAYGHGTDQALGSLIAASALHRARFLARRGELEQARRVLLDAKRRRRPIVDSSLSTAHRRLEGLDEGTVVELDVSEGVHQFED